MEPVTDFSRRLNPLADENYQVRLQDICYRREYDTPDYDILRSQETLLYSCILNVIGVEFITVSKYKTIDMAKEDVAKQAYRFFVTKWR
ncbi:hypothetical protein HI914_02571 [Erysiphe necator]|uniref:Uncharacterized protein n=1 Tax=Uncinula necator TaxID=52586 RepID=A0A0B1PF72_UNCNE|nr:hypothetical protein HI914_02571 [Erysiphe necator]KHJ35965.1 hypothetical protein EV44_g5921 [Erysiphe necator]